MSGNESFKRIAMWSGPRNISTALMRSFENRADCCVVDEPFYAYYLAQTGLEHPDSDLVLQSQPTDPARVISGLAEPPAGGEVIQYEKHMAHHLLPGLRTDWMQPLTHCLLLRDPRAMIASYIKTRSTVTLDDLGLPQLMDLHLRITEMQGSPPLVIDSDDILSAPEAMLRALCERLGIGFDTRMLSWPAGKRDTDGVWAPWWYEKVEASTGFEKRAAFEGTLPDRVKVVAEAAMPIHAELLQHKIEL